MQRLITALDLRLGIHVHQTAIPERERGVHRLATAAEKRRRELQRADELGCRRIADVEIDERRRVTHGRELAVRTDHGRPVERTWRIVGPRLASLLARHPPTAGFLGMGRIAEVEDHWNALIEPYGRRRQVRVADIGLAI